MLFETISLVNAALNIQCYSHLNHSVVHGIGTAVLLRESAVVTCIQLRQHVQRLSIFSNYPEPHVSRKIKTLTMGFKIATWRIGEAGLSSSVNSYGSIAQKLYWL